MEQLQNVVISHGRLTAKRPNGGDVAVPIQPAVLTAAGLKNAKSLESFTFERDLWAPILWTSLATRAWMGEHGGVVLNTASIGGMGFEANLGLYNASKAALIHLTKQLALELAPKVRVNAVAPGVVRTKLAEALWKDLENQLNSAAALGRIGEPEDVGVARRHDDSIANVRVAAQRRLDLAEFHPETAPFDLLVGPADGLERAVGSPPCKIAGRVQPLAGHKWVGDEPQRRPRRSPR